MFTTEVDMTQDEEVKLDAALEAWAQRRGMLEARKRYPSGPIVTQAFGLLYELTASQSYRRMVSVAFGADD
jgi:hypothetical protein